MTIASTTPTRFAFDRAWTFPLPAAQLFDRFGDTADFRRWWSWLHRFDVSGSPALQRGRRASCVIQGPVPYTLRVDIEIERVEPPELVETYVRGDLDGPARLEVHPAGEGSTARLCWDLELCDATLLRISRFARPVMEWAHDRVVALGVEQFRRHAVLPSVAAPDLRVAYRPG